MHPVLRLTKCKSSSAILGAVELILYWEDTPGCYKLHNTSSKHLRKMEYVCRVELGTDSASSETVVEDPIDENQLPDDFYEIEDVVEQRLSHKTLTYEHRVRFKGYSSEDDMWLPASYFNRAINFESLSKFGRKRKHKIDPDAAQELANKKRKTSINKEKQGLATAKSANRKKRTAKSEKKLEERNKGKAFRSTLPPKLDPNSATSKTSGLLKSGNRKKLTETKKDVMSVIDVEDNPSDEIPLDFGLLSEVLRQDDNFRYPRRLLAEASFPNVNATLTSYTVGSSGSAMMEPITVKELPPQSVLNDIKKEFATSQNVASQLVVKINSFGDFNKDGIRILERYHRLKRLRAEVSFEKKWIKTVFKKNPFKEVTHALLNRWKLESSYLASYGSYRITSQELSLL